ncbi:MAG: DUF2933 domain-containing protein [Vulcanimicrobiaceae bacterium]
MSANSTRGQGWPFPAKVAFVGFLLVAAFFLWTEHRAHLLGYWPYLFVLACPLMHLFMHHGGGHGDSAGTPGAQR